MPIKSIIVKKSNHEHDIIWKEVDEEEVNEDLRRIRSHVMNEVEEEKEEKYKQLEFELEDNFNLTEDQVSPI